MEEDKDEDRFNLNEVMPDKTKEYPKPKPEKEKE